MCRGSPGCEQLHEHALEGYNCIFVVERGNSKERRRRRSSIGTQGSGGNGNGSQERKKEEKERDKADNENHHPDIVNRHFAELYNVDSVQMAATARVRLLSTIIYSI